MRMVKFIVQLLMLAVILFTVTSITEGATPSVMASTSIQGDISFSSIDTTGYIYAGSVHPLHSFQLWHYSGGYWGNETYGLRIDDSDMFILAGGEILTEKLMQQRFKTTLDLPPQVMEYLSQAGPNGLQNVKMRFRSTGTVDPQSIFDIPKYILTYTPPAGANPATGTIYVEFRPKYYISREAFATPDEIPGLNVEIWQPRSREYGYVTFSIYTRGGAHLGQGSSDYVPNPIQPGDIKNKEGHLAEGKSFTVTTQGYQLSTYDGSQIKVGHNTFHNGGAVGLEFFFPMSVDFYIPNPTPLDTIRIHYVDDQGAELLPSEKISPTAAGPHTVSAKTINGYELISPSSVTVNIQYTDTEHQVTFIYKLPEPGGPVAVFTWSPMTPKAKQTVQFTDLSYHPDGVEIVDWRWYVQIITNLHGKNPTHAFHNEGTYQVKLVVQDANGKTDSIVKYITVEPADPKYPPTACINAPSRLIAGDKASISSCSTDPDGEIVDYLWSWSGQGTPDAPGDLENNATSGNIFFMQPGRQVVSLIVRDNDGLTDYAEAYIDVQAPYPYAHMNVGGTLKENRKVILDASQSMGTMFYPINQNLTTWEITPLDGQNVASIKFKGHTNVGHQKEVLFKQPGRYHVLLTVYNTYGNYGQTEQIITIAEDKPPVALFTVPERVYRDPNNGNKATITLRDQSYSPDGDTIQQRIWMYRYDEHNDGSLDGNWHTIDSGNQTEVSIEVSEVGRYYFILIVKEGFGQDTIPEFVHPIDYKQASLRSGD